MNEEKIKKQIEEIEKEIETTPYHKGTEHHIGKLKAKLAKLRHQIIETQKKKKGCGRGFAVKKQGDATAVLVGMPSVGKSTLLNRLTKAESKVGHYPFTTLTVIPGVMHYKGAHIQIFDVPGLIKGAAVGRGSGKEILSVVRVADLLVLIASAEDPETLKLMEKELRLAGVRIEQKPPLIEIEKRNRDGIEISGAPSSISEKTIKSLLQSFKIINAKIIFREKINQDQLIDTLLGNRVYVPAIKVFSKADLINSEQQKSLCKKIGDECLFVSSKYNIGIEELKRRIFEKLDLVRIYLRQSPKAKPEKEPLIGRRGMTVKEAAERISEKLAEEIKGAKIKGPSALFLNQLVGKNHCLQDEDQIFFVK